MDGSILSLGELEFTLTASIQGELEEPYSMTPLQDVYSLKFRSGELKVRVLGDGKAFFVSMNGSGKTTQEGIAAILQLLLPIYRRVLVYHHTYDPPNYMGAVSEPYDYPVKEEVGEFMLSPWTFPWHTDKLEDLPRSLKISQLLFETSTGYLFLLAASSKGYISYFTQPTHSTLKQVVTASVEHPWEDLPLFVYSISKDPYEAIETAYTLLASQLGKLCLLRKYKGLPESMRYLGWCTWNAFWRNIDEEKILKGIMAIREEIPVGMLLIDDGWMQEKEGMLTSFEEDPQKFPSGFKKLLEKARSIGIKSIGLWLTINGYWNGIHPKSNLAERFECELMDIGDQKVPHPNRGFRLYLEWFNMLREKGFNFIKVDNQYALSTVYAGYQSLEESSRKLHEALEAAAAITGLDILNCMSLNPEHFFNWYKSSVVRASIDYSVPPTKSRSKLHLYFNAYNSLWLSHLAWPDWDMFQTTDPLAVQHAVARAISGGPIYITDEPRKSRREVASPLVLDSGQLPLLDGPALPTPDIIMRDPYNEKVPLKLQNKITIKGVGTYHLLAIFNIYKKDEPLTYDFKLQDLDSNSKEAVVFEYFSGRLEKIRGSDSLSGVVDPGSVHLYIVAPIIDGLALIGTPNLYIMPAIFEHLERKEESSLLLYLREKKTFLAYLERPMMMDGSRVENGLKEIHPKKDVIILKIKD